MNHPNIDTSNFWWNQENKNIDNEGILQEKKYNKNTNIKNCYPFVLRYSEVSENDDNINNHLIQCPLCIWYRFCPGCIINPNGDLTKFTSKFGIVVDWCYSFVIQEFQNFNFLSVKEIDNQVISENFPIFDKDQNYQSINDCFNLFFEEEKLEEPLFCPNCKGPEDFTKCYSINRLPYVLILSLKRFKLNQNSNFKLRKMITYPLYDLEIGNDKVKKKYDLYGIVNHYGSINSGHYTAFIKKGKQWILCNDSQVGPIEENKVMHANAYILFYICQESPYKNDYFKYMKSIMNKIIIKDKKEVIFQKDNNFFKGEPVITKYGEGYVVKENLVDFKCDDNYDIYTELKNEDKLRIENLNKKHKKEEKKNKQEKKTDKKGKNKKEPKDEKDDKKDEKKNKEENKDNNKEENKDEQKNIKEDNKQDDKKEEEKDIKNEGKLEEVNEENKEEKNNLKDDDKNDKQENKEEIKEGKNKENKEGQKEDKNEDKNKENQKDNINEEKNGDKKIEIKEEQNYIKNEADNEEQKEEKNKEINNDQNNKCDEKNEEQKKIKNEELNEEQKDNKIDKKNKDKNKDINEEKNDSKKEEQNEERTSDKIDENNEKENKDKNEEQNEGYKDEKNEEKNNNDINKEQKDKKEKEKNGQQNDKYEEQTNYEKNSEIKEEQIADKNEEKGKGKEIEINIDKKENENKIEKKKYSGINKEIVNKNEDDEEKEKIFQEDENNKSDINNENKNEKIVNEDNKKIIENELNKEDEENLNKIENIENNENKEPIEIKENSKVNDLKEILSYYKQFLFDSKKDDIALIEYYIQNNDGKINYEKYEEDLQTAKEMNKRSDIINYLLNEDNNNKAKNEEYIKKTCERWKNIEQQIKDQKTIKIPRRNRELLIKYINNENNKNKLLLIFDKEILNSFIEASTCIDKSRELLNNPETKKEEIKSIEDYLLKGVDNVKVTNMLLIDSLTGFPSFRTGYIPSVGVIDTP